MTNIVLWFQRSMKAAGDHFVHTVFDLYSAPIQLRTVGGFHANSLTLGFLAALGQARYLQDYGLVMAVMIALS